MTPSKEALQAAKRMSNIQVMAHYDKNPLTLEEVCTCIDTAFAEYREQVSKLVDAFPTVPHPGGRLVSVIGVYEDGTKQHVDGDVVLRALAPFLEQETVTP